MGDTLLCWNSVRAGDEVLLQAIKSFKNRKIIIDDVLLIEQEGHKFSSSGLMDVRLKKISVQLEDPTKHADIYNVVVNKVLPEIDPKSCLHINVSPGTPAMHAVWLVLHAGGRLPGAKLWSSQFSPKTKRRSLKEVEFPINTYLSEIRKVKAGEDHFARYDFESSSEKRREALESLKRFAVIPGVPLLVLGERGTGKTRLVETTLKAFKSGKEIVVVPCGALDSELADSLIFGHKKGAFTGAEQDRDGLLKAAEGGILFLDEIQDLPKATQRKLVRVLQDRKRRFRPVGADKELSGDFELVCASNKTLDELQDVLDQDFFDRISMATITIPALRECRDDLEHDWQQVWQEARLDSKLPACAPFSDSLLKLLRDDPLYGNLRDLQKMAVLIMAWWSDQGLEQTLSNAEREWKRFCLQRNSKRRFKKNLSRKEQLEECRYELAVWARQEYSTWENAAKALGCTEKTLRNDAGLK